MRISVVTTTANRELALKRCEYQVRRCAQHVDVSVEWIVSSGGSPETAHTVSPNLFLRNFPFKNPAQNLCNNMINGVAAAGGDLIVVMEDDDWYAPDYLKAILDNIGDADLFGIKPITYYHVPSRSYSIRSFRQSCLCATAFRAERKREVIDLCTKCLFDKEPLIDRELWGKSFASLQIERHDLYVGIKGLPGQAGIGSGHRPEKNGRWQLDDDASWLRSRVGEEDFDFYQQFMEG